MIFCYKVYRDCMRFPLCELGSKCPGSNLGGVSAVYMRLCRCLLNQYFINRTRSGRVPSTGCTGVPRLLHLGPEVLGPCSLCLCKSNALSHPVSSTNTLGKTEAHLGLKFYLVKRYFTSDCRIADTPEELGARPKVLSHTPLHWTPYSASTRPYWRFLAPRAIWLGD